MTYEGTVTEGAEMRIVEVTDGEGGTRTTDRIDLTVPGDGTWTVVAGSPAA